jgi:DNA-directed RNA polymerase subunit L
VFVNPIYTALVIAVVRGMTGVLSFGSPDCAFAGYSIPHPCEDIMNVRVQTTGQVTANEALKQSLHDLILVGETVQAKFSEAVVAQGGDMDVDDDAL